MIGAPDFHDPRRSSKPGIGLSLTIEEATLAEEALRHVAREVFFDDPRARRLEDAAAAIAAALPPTTARTRGTRS